MPFQSEKQRRFLHANHPEIAKRWEKEYSHGGILDIGGSEEITTDDGNDIELTAYNAAFDDPNDLSTGVKSLFRAKDGGRTNYIYGGITHPGGRRGFPGGSGRPGDRAMPVGGSGANYGGPPGGGDPGMTYTAPHVPHSPTDTKENIEALQLGDLKKTVLDFEEEKGGPEYYGLRDLQDRQTKLTTKIKDKLEGDWKRYIDPSAWDTIKTMFAMSSFSGILKEVYKGIKRKKEMQDFMQDLKDLGLAGGPPGTNDPLYDQLWLHLEKQKRDDEGLGVDDMPKPIYDPITGAVSEEYAQGQGQYGYPNTSLDQIRAGQAKYADYMEKVEREKAMFANSGGLANLFRVKNQ
jgi:hypothetical protein